MKNMERKEILDLLKAEYLALHAAERAEQFDMELVKKLEIRLELKVEFILLSTGWINSDDL